MLKPVNFFRTVLVDQEVAASTELGHLINVIRVLSDRFYQRDLKTCDQVNPDSDEKGAVLSVDKTINPEELSAEQANCFYFKKNDMYDSNREWNPHELESDWLGEKYEELLYVEKNAIVFSENEFVLPFLGISKTTDWRVAVLILAAAGVDVVLPPVAFEKMNEEQAEQLRQCLADERLEYLASIRELGGAAAAKIASKDYSDIKEWAIEIVSRRIWPKAVRLRFALEKQPKTLLEEIR